MDKFVLHRILGALPPVMPKSGFEPYLVSYPHTSSVFAAPNFDVYDVTLM